MTAPAFTYKNAPAQLPLPGADNDRQEVAVLKRLSTHNLPRFRHGRVDPVDVVPDEQAVPHVVHLYLQATAVQPGDKALCGTAKAAPNRYGTRYRWPNVPPDTQPCVVCVSLMQDGGV